MENTMPSNQMLTVRIPAEDLDKLDKIAELEGRPRSQIIQDAVSELIAKNHKLRSLELARMQKKLTPAIKEQCELMEKSGSFSDESRGF